MDFLPILKRFHNKRILVIGDLILDCYVWGKVTRISPEAPVPIVDVSNNTTTLGGAANVACNIVSLGGAATVIGVMGRDWAADTMKEHLREKKIDYVNIMGKRPTTIKTRVIAHSQQVVRFDQESRDNLSSATLKTLIKNIEDLVPEHDAILISDYKKGIVSAEVMRTVLKATHGKKFVSVDPKLGHFHLYKKVSLITPNLMEASNGANIEIKDESSLIKAGWKLVRNLGCSAVLITRGEDGMSLFHKGKVIHIPTASRKVFDVTGAGDTVIAAFTLAHTAGASMEHSAFIANHAAGQVVGEVGTVAASQSGLAQSLKGVSHKKIKKSSTSG